MTVTSCALQEANGSNDELILILILDLNPISAFVSELVFSSREWPG
jgi:hypothetical protein